MEETDYGFSRRLTTFEIIESASRLSLLPQLRIKFNFSLSYKTSTMILNQDSTVHMFTGQCPSSEYQNSIVITVRGSLSYHDVREAIGKAIGGRLLNDELRHLIVLAWKEVLRNFPTKTLPRSRLLSLDFHLVVEYWHLVVVESDDVDDHGMVPAADSSLRLLEKYEVDSLRINGGSTSCCICLEELSGGGGGAVRMPCFHVFHGGCIEKWLRRSHYCPLCRYEMPTE
ncbi:hypothetical protein C2S53_008721 [Perilla frutescens var. hirtella]|uniref:RING-type E3 ubiquitin transferase n=1 Tax=Perilla frutescens var. hirtella TaxID=608512 RepID=A0AAD4P428_PERFH|nr:hypothetical protein C2S53_008721 [Perilla frutescens var. hirtella]